MEATVTCSNCIEPIATWCFQCNVCCDLKLCISCFRCGAELGSHQRIHSYRVRVIDSPVVFLPDDDKLLHEPWTLKEELRLLETVEAFNLGDWQDVQKCINPKRTAEEISCHYEDCYLNGRLGKEVSNGLTYAQISDHTSTFSSPLEASRTDGGSGVCFNKYNSHDLRLLAYMPHRDDFEKVKFVLVALEDQLFTVLWSEFMNDAESLISNLLFISDGKQVEHGATFCVQVCITSEAQLCLISMYISRLNERRKCKNLISEYDLISQFLKEQKPCGIHNYWKYSPADVRRMKEERELKEGFRRFCQFIPVSELEALISNLMSNGIEKAAEKIASMRGSEAVIFEHFRIGGDVLCEQANAEEVHVRRFDM
ncbi:hypothetical protein TTRE_0000073701 [Trichuris trichiura]|uniref:Transcriptional adapter 2-alpha n=1 Tax=Trichuris trichiura TaxID=36087 RepID=A0A077Z1N3_TRITR|nr:hypothetical protein TTRE_0000073701 [Trichuris trichiura]